MHEESLHVWKELLELSPNNKVIMTRLADSYRNLEDYEKAEIYYRTALGIGYDYYATLGLVFIYKAKGNYDEAVKILEDIFQKEPYNSRTLYELVMCYKDMGEQQKAVKVLEDQILANNQISAPLMEIYNNLKAK
jgi:tetratricopeptide (TPR) repeat protein